MHTIYSREAHGQKAGKNTLHISHEGVWTSRSEEPVSRGVSGTKVVIAAASFVSGLVLFWGFGAILEPRVRETRFEKQNGIYNNPSAIYFYLNPLDFFIYIYSHFRRCVRISEPSNWVRAELESFLERRYGRSAVGTISANLHELCAVFRGFGH